MERRAQNQEQVDSPEQQDAEHLHPQNYFSLSSHSIPLSPSSMARNIWQLCLTLTRSLISATLLTAMKNGLQAQG